MSKLDNKKHEKFAHAYCVNLNATQAYLEVYGERDESSASSAGSQLLRNLKVKDRIAELLDKTNGESDLKAVYVLIQLKAACEVNQLENVRIKYSEALKLPIEIQKIITRVISHTNQQKRIKPDDIISLEFIDKKYATDKLGSYLAMWQNNHNIKLGDSYDEVMMEMEQERLRQKKVKEAKNATN